MTAMAVENIAQSSHCWQSLKVPRAGIKPPTSGYSGQGRRHVWRTGLGEGDKKGSGQTVLLKEERSLGYPGGNRKKQWYTICVFWVGNRKDTDCKYKFKKY